MEKQISCPNCNHDIILEDAITQKYEQMYQTRLQQEEQKRLVDWSKKNDEFTLAMKQFEADKNEHQHQIQEKANELANKILNEEKKTVE